MKLSMRTCHPVTRMPVEIENTHANQGAQFTIAALNVLDMMNYAHAYGSATHVELSIRTCHPVTRMTLEIMVNADQGSLFPIVVDIYF